MKVTKLGYPQPILNSGLGLNAGGRVPPGGTDLQVLTSNGSNGRYWGENVARITANGSNTVLGPYVDFSGGSNTTVSASSNTIRIHVTGITSDPADDEFVWMPLTSVASNSLTPELVWGGDDALIPTLVPLE